MHKRREMNATQWKRGARRMSAFTAMLLFAAVSSTAVVAPTALVVVKEMPAKGVLWVGDVN